MGVVFSAAGYGGCFYAGTIYGVEPDLGRGGRIFVPGFLAGISGKFEKRIEGGAVACSGSNHDPVHHFVLGTTQRDDSGSLHGS